MDPSLKLPSGVPKTWRDTASESCHWRFLMETGMRICKWTCSCGIPGCFGASRCGRKNKVHWGPRGCAHREREKELMKWQCSATSGATNEPLWREGTAERFWRSRLTALFWCTMSRGNGGLSFLYFYKLEEQFTLRWDTAATFSSHLEIL